MSKFTRDPEIEISGSAAGTMASATGASVYIFSSRVNGGWTLGLKGLDFIAHVADPPSIVSWCGRL